MAAKMVQAINLCQSANPWSEGLEQIVQKFISDKAQGNSLLLDYSSTCPSKEAAYRGALNSITLAGCTFPPHTKLFLSENGKASGPTPWSGGTWAIWVDGTLTPCHQRWTLPEFQLCDSDMRRTPT